MNRYRFDKENHVHLLDEKPLNGTSTISGIISTGSALSWWASGKALEKLGWTATKSPKKERLETAEKILEAIKTMGGKIYLSLLDECYKNHKTKLDDAADKGIDLHAQLELFIIRTMQGVENADDGLDMRITPFVEWSQKNVKRFLLTEGYCYSEKLWTGGICDAMAEMFDGTIALIDFKSAKSAYFKHFVQCAGYALEIEENGWFDCDGNKLDYLEQPIDRLIVVPFGAEVVVPVEPIQGIGEYKQAFESAAKLHSIMGKDK